MTGFCGGIIVNDPAARGHMSPVVNYLSSLAVDASDITGNNNLSTVLDSHISVSIMSFESGAGSVKTRTTPKIEYVTVSKHWGIISPDHAIQIFQTTN